MNMTTKLPPLQKSYSSSRTNHPLPRNKDSQIIPHARAYFAEHVFNMVLVLPLWCIVGGAGGVRFLD
eukprot:154505-Ditylum_brightwellii.AAC.1